MPFKSGYDAYMMRIDSDGSDLGSNMPQVREGYGAVIHWPGHPKKAQECGAPLGSPVQSNLGGTEAVVGPGLGNQPPAPGKCTSERFCGNVVPFPIRPMMVTDDDLRAIWMVQVMAMAGMTVGLGRQGQNKQGYKCDK